MVIRLGITIFYPTAATVVNISSYGAIGESNIESFYLKEKDREFLIIVCYRRIKQIISSFCLPTEVVKTLGNPQ